MANITEAYQQLSKFSKYENVPSILIMLEALELPGEIDSTIVESLRKQLNTILSSEVNTSFAINNVLSLADAAYNALLALAELMPINNDDPISQCEINASNRIFVSTGYQFDIKNLIKWHNERGYRVSTLSETPDSKWLLNPITNQKFPTRDVLHIQKVAAEKSIEIKFLKQEEQTPLLSSSHSFFMQPSLVRSGYITATRFESLTLSKQLFLEYRAFNYITSGQLSIEEALELYNEQENLIKWGNLKAVFRNVDELSTGDQLRF